MIRRLGRIATSTPVRVLVSLGLLGAVAASIDWEALVDGLADASWGWFVLSIGVIFAGSVIASVRWHGLLQGADVHVTQREALRAYLIGMFTNNLLPSAYGGDAVRAWVVGRSGKPLARALTSVIVDRVSAMACLVLLAWIAAVIKADEIPSGIVVLLGIATGLSALAGLAALAVARRRGLGRFLPDAVRPWTGEVASVIRIYERNGRLLGGVLALGLVYQATMLAGIWLIAESLGLDLDVAELTVVVPPVLLAALLPISLAGFGVREGAFVVLLAEFGISSADATLLSLLSVAAVTIASLPGGVSIVKVGPRRGQSTSPADMR